MRAILLAAGVGQRLNGFVDEQGNPLPKCMLRFGGKTLLELHIEALAACQVPRIDVVVGYRQQEVASELAAATKRVGGIDGGIIENPQFDRGSIISLSTSRAIFTEQASVIMDADVLYPKALLHRLVASPHANCFLLDESAAPARAIR